MKILIASDCYKYNMNGVTTSILALCSGFRRRGHEVKVLSLSYKHLSFREGDDYYIRSYSAADIYVADPTFEVHSMSYMEAMASGLPLLCRADDSLEGVLEHGQNGLIWNCKEQFVNLVCKLQSDDALRASMAGHAIQKAEGFSNDTYASAMLHVYETATNIDQFQHPRFL